MFNAQGNSIILITLSESCLGGKRRGKKKYFFLVLVDFYYRSEIITHISFISFQIFFEDKSIFVLCHLQYHFSFLHAKTGLYHNVFDKRSEFLFIQYSDKNTAQSRKLVQAASW